MPLDGSNYQQQSLNNELLRARLRFARNQIADGKWCQEHEQDNNGNRCLIAWADGFQAMPWIGSYAIYQLWHALPKSAQNPARQMHTDLARYNDTHTRNAVIKLLDRAINAA